MKGIEAFVCPVCNKKIKDTNRIYTDNSRVMIVNAHLFEHIDKNIKRRYGVNDIMKDHSYYKTRRRLRKERGFIREPEPFFQTQQMLKDVLFDIIHELEKSKQDMHYLLTVDKAIYRIEQVLNNYNAIIARIDKYTLFLKKCAENP